MMSTNQVLAQFYETLKQRPLLLVAPVVLCSMTALAFALLKPATWQASQALLVRDEAVGSITGQGRFSTMESMKAAHETVQDVARSRLVVGAALRNIDPPRRYFRPQNWPTQSDVEDTRKAISITPPAGAEFGSTEVVYLTTKSYAPERALKLADVVCEALQKRLKQLRNAKAQSVIDELDNTLQLAKRGQDAAVEELRQLETRLGKDLNELVVLNSGNGTSELRGTLTAIKTELRRVRMEQEVANNLKEQLLAARVDPAKIIATPNSLLESQPGLRRLKDGLVDAQLRTSQLSGMMQPEHPRVKAAVLAEAAVRQNLHKEVAIALEGVESQNRINNNLITSLETRRDNIGQNLDRLASLKATYSNLLAKVANHSQIVDKARDELSAAKARQAAAQSASLVTRLEKPETGDKPLGPGKTMICLGGFAGGWLIGAGLLFLMTPLGRPHGRRWSDCMGFGRRAGDHNQGNQHQRNGHQGNGRPGHRRAEDSQPGQQPMGGNEKNEKKAQGWQRRANDAPALCGEPGAFDLQLAAAPTPPPLELTSEVAVSCPKTSDQSGASDGSEEEQENKSQSQQLAAPVDDAPREAEPDNHQATPGDTPQGPGCAPEQQIITAWNTGLDSLQQIEMNQPE